MKIPFKLEQFYHVFEQYNMTPFPAQILILLFGIVAVIFLHLKTGIKSWIIGLFLGLLWIWIGVAYHFSFFTSINKAAFVFGGVFVLQGVLLLTETFITRRLKFDFKGQPRDYFGYLFVLFGWLICKNTDKV